VSEITNAKSAREASGQRSTFKNTGEFILVYLLKHFIRICFDLHHCMSFYRPYWSKKNFVFRRKAIFVRRLWTRVPHQVWHAGMHFVISI
jgi:hypothetical protein